MSEKVKVVLYCQGSSYDKGTPEQDPNYGAKGMIRRDIERVVGSIEYHNFSGYLAGKNLQDFMEQAKDADVVILDAWTHFVSDRAWGGHNSELAQEEMADVARRVGAANPKVEILAELMEGSFEVAVHAHAKPFPGYWAHCFIPSVLKAKLLKEQENGEPLAEVLVVDDSFWHLMAAPEQFKGRKVLICDTYLEAIELLDKHRFDAVMTDLLMPTTSENQGPESKKEHVGKLMPMGAFVAAKALEAGVKQVCVVSDTDHHDHPVGHVAEKLSTSGPVRWYCGCNCKMTKNDVGTAVKNWAAILDSDS
ncbi:MAG: response regulator [Patescibacteria group bacterium]